MAEEMTLFVNNTVVRLGVVWVCFRLVHITIRTCCGCSRCCGVDLQSTSSLRGRGGGVVLRSIIPLHHEFAGFIIPGAFTWGSKVRWNHVISYHFFPWHSFCSSSFDISFYASISTTVERAYAVSFLLETNAEKPDDGSSITALDFSTDKEALQATTRYRLPQIRMGYGAVLKKYLSIFANNRLQGRKRAYASRRDEHAEMVPRGSYAFPHG